MTFTVPEFQTSLLLFTFIAVLISTCTMSCLSEYQRYKFFKRAKSLKDVEEWSVSPLLDKGHKMHSVGEPVKENGTERS